MLARQWQLCQRRTSQQIACGPCCESSDAGQCCQLRPVANFVQRDVSKELLPRGFIAPRVNSIESNGSNHGFLLKARCPMSRRK
jgi:hypothetical protein